MNTITCGSCEHRGKANHLLIHQAINADTAQVLTLALAHDLIGKRIQTKYYGYRGQDGTDEFVVTEILTEYDLAKREPMDGYASRADYWEQALGARVVEESRRTLEILGENGYRTCIRCHTPGLFNELTFTCSDADRPVLFVEV